MSAYSTKDITRKQAEEMVRQVRAKKDRSVEVLSLEELDDELHEYVYSEKHSDIVGFLNNYNIETDLTECNCLSKPPCPH